MNHFLQNNLIIVIIFLLLFIFLLMGGAIFILFKLLLKEKNTNPELKPIESAVLEVEIISKKEIIEKESIVEKYTCIHHKDAPSVGSCLICEEVFCVDCLIDHESMHFCKEHFRIYAHFKWKQITDIRTTPDTPNDGLYIYNFKRQLWSNQNIPTFVMTHYKINIENDYIESFIQLNVREEDVERLSFELEKQKVQI